LSIEKDQRGVSLDKGSRKRIFESLMAEKEIVSASLRNGNGE
jgi:hypothetical protein